MPLHRPFGHAMTSRSFARCTMPIQFERLRAFLQRPHHQVAGKLVPPSAVQHERHRHIVQAPAWCICIMARCSVARLRMAAWASGSLPAFERRAQDVDRAPVIDRQPVVGAALAGGIALLQGERQIRFAPVPPAPAPASNYAGRFRLRSGEQAHPGLHRRPFTPRLPSSISCRG